MAKKKLKSIGDKKEKELRKSGNGGTASITQKEIDAIRKRGIKSVDELREIEKFMRGK